MYVFFDFGSSVTCAHPHTLKILCVCAPVVWNSLLCIDTHETMHGYQPFLTWESFESRSPAIHLCFSSMLLRRIETCTCVHVYVYVCICICMYVYAYLCVYIYIYIYCCYVYNIHVCVYTYTHMCVYMYVCVCAHTSRFYVRMGACMCLFITSSWDHMLSYKHIYMHTNILACIQRDRCTAMDISCMYYSMGIDLFSGIIDIHNTHL